MQIIDTIVVRAQNAWFAARDEESGQTLVEYALIIALIGIASIVALTFLSGRINNLFNKTGNILNNAT
jgi:pilus assembly protein Flp/PilA